MRGNGHISCMCSRHCSRDASEREILASKSYTPFCRPAAGYLQVVVVKSESLTICEPFPLQARQSQGWQSLAHPPTTCGLSMRGIEINNRVSTRYRGHCRHRPNLAVLPVSRPPDSPDLRGKGERERQERGCERGVASGQQILALRSLVSCALLVVIV